MLGGLDTPTGGNVCVDGQELSGMGKNELAIFRRRKIGFIFQNYNLMPCLLYTSHTARTMLANSEFIIMLNQASTDRIELAKLLNISDLQMSYITNVGAGQGLLKVGSSLVPFVNQFPRNTELYKLMTTKFGEV